MTRRRIIEFESICKSYGNKEILKNLNLCIDKGEFLTIIGSSGCGKTTLLKLVNGLIMPDKGRVLVYGEDISKISKIKLRRKIGYVIQEVGLFPHMNVRKNISYVLDLINKDNKRSIQERTEYLIKSVGLSKEILNRYPGELSGGQRQRIGIARALAAKPNIVLMDEPFGAVDEITRKLLQEEILRIYNEFNVTIIFITHDIREALKLGTRVIVMDEGNIIQSGTPTEIRENPKTIFVKELIGA
ncbi:ABC transporter family protein [Clostridium botulinum 202F]|nr:ABC transporter family protein [Clostridium botulinum 202F]KAI3348736.1 ABC transporter ATP-binding protein [Clostridium botulinum]KON12450.1 glycine/betaine ABC transporter ATP-binding protein [Clostridium botulinum]MBY6985546.1 ABC transporter ATP-binding protein [Clostridium botulinum]NFG99340.1 ABC transporter ATP-binding protein [Clostridium botulinum]